MLIVDASGLYEVITEGPRAEWVRQQLELFDELAAPELVDVEVVGLLRRDTAAQLLDVSRAEIALGELSDWPGERVPHRSLSKRVWELRGNVRTTDAFYVALAETLLCPLLTLDVKLARANGPQCEFIIPEPHVPVTC